MRSGLEHQELEEIELSYVRESEARAPAADSVVSCGSVPPVSVKSVPLVPCVNLMSQAAVASRSVAIGSGADPRIGGKRQGQDFGLLAAGENEAWTKLGSEGN